MKRTIGIVKSAEITYNGEYCGEIDNPHACQHYDLDISMDRQFDGCKLFNKNWLRSKGRSRERCGQCLIAVPLTEERVRVRYVRRNSWPCSIENREVNDVVEEIEVALSETFLHERTGKRYYYLQTGHGTGVNLLVEE